MNAPQIILIALLGIEWGFHIAKHGAIRPNYHGGHKTVDIAIFTTLIWWGGFFS